MDELEKLFVWRGVIDSRTSNLITWTDKKRCQFCKDIVTPNKRAFSADGHNWGSFKDDAICSEYQCPSCGWIQGEWTSWHEGTKVRVYDQKDGKRKVCFKSFQYLLMKLR